MAALCLSCNKDDLRMVVSVRVFTDGRVCSCVSLRERLNRFL